MWEHVEEFSDIEKALNETAVPRLQVTGERVNGDAKNQVWEYCMIYKHFTQGIVKLPINTQTREATGATSLLDEDGKVNPTMRNEADSKWDSIQMNIPLFYIADGVVEKVDLSEFKEIFKDRIVKESDR